MLLLHIIAGALALACGAAALFTGKGAAWHRRAGSLFFAAMLVVCVSAMVLAVTLKQEFPFVPLLIGYLVATSWVTVKRPPGTTGRFEQLACFVILANATALFVGGMDPANGPDGSNESGLYFFFGGIAALAGLLDLNTILRGGLTGVHRIARHLWRMCFALTGAMASFLAQEDFLPAFLAESNWLWLPLLAMLVLTIFWLIRVVFTAWADKKASSAVT